MSVQEFRGRLLVSIREYYDDEAGERRPGKKGSKSEIPSTKLVHSLTIHVILLQIMLPFSCDYYNRFVGISLSVEQWEKLKEAIPKIDQQLHDKS